MSIKTNRLNPSEQLKRNKNIRIFQTRCPSCSFREFLTLYDGEEVPDTKIGRSVRELPIRCPHCGAEITATEFPLFTR